jgi:hypothetical protein
MIQTFVVYGYAARPGSLELHWLRAGRRTGRPLVWRTESNARLPGAGLAEINGMATATAAYRPMRLEREAVLPFVIDEAVELSPLGWTREASAPPLPANLLTPIDAVHDLDRPTRSQFVLFIVDSADEIESTAGYDEDDGTTVTSQACGSVASTGTACCGPLSPSWACRRRACRTGSGIAAALRSHPASI